MVDKLVTAYLKVWFGFGKNYGFAQPTVGHDIFCHLDNFVAVIPSPDCKTIVFLSPTETQGQWPHEYDPVYCEVIPGNKGLKAERWFLKTAYDTAQAAITLGHLYQILDAETNQTIWIGYHSQLDRRDIQLRCFGKTVQWQVSLDSRRPDTSHPPTWEDCQPAI